MQSRFIAELLFLKMDGKCTFRFLDAVFSNQTQLEEVANLHFDISFGSLPMLQVKDTGITVYSIVNDDFQLGTPEAKEAHISYRNKFIFSIKSFDLFLWFVKDTSVFAVKLYAVAYN